MSRLPLIVAKALPVLVLAFRMARVPGLARARYRAATRSSSRGRGFWRSFGSRSKSSDHRASSSGSSAGWITLLSHSPTERPDARAASRAAARASGRRPLRFHGPPDFILASKPDEEQDAPCFEPLRVNSRRRGPGVLSSQVNVQDYGKEPVKVTCAAPRQTRSGSRPFGRRVTVTVTNRVFVCAAC